MAFSLIFSLISATKWDFCDDLNLPKIKECFNVLVSALKSWMSLQ